MQHIFERKLRGFNLNAIFLEQCSLGSRPVVGCEVMKAEGVAYPLPPCCGIIHLPAIMSFRERN